MYLNYMSLFSCQIIGDHGDAYDFLLREYASNISNEATNGMVIKIEFANDEISDKSYIVRDPVSYDENGTFIFDKNGKIARIDYDYLGYKGFILKCDPDFHPAFFAIFVDYIASIYALSKEFVFCHSVAFQYNDSVILCPAWRNVGKTNLLLKLMHDDIQYLSDDWCVITSNGGLKKIPKNMYLFDYNFKSNPDLVGLVDEKIESLMEFSNKVDDGYYDLGHDIRSDIKENLKARVEPEKIFGESVLESVEEINYIFYLSKNIADPERGVYIEKLNKSELINNIIGVSRLEQSPFELAYTVHKSRTGMCNDIIDNKDENMRNILEKSFVKSQMYEMHTPGQSSVSDVKRLIKSVIVSNKNNED